MKRRPPTRRRPGLGWRSLMMRPPVDDRLWGKFRGLEDVGPYPVICHLIDTAVIAGQLWDSYLTVGQRSLLAKGWDVAEAHARQLVMFWAGLHDLGKLCPAFQHQTPEAAAGLLEDPAYPVPGDRSSIRHERVSHLTAPSLLAQVGYPTNGRPLRSIAHQIGQILGGHHGAYGNALSARVLTSPEDQEPRVGVDGWSLQRAAHLHTLHALCGSPEPPAQFAPGGACVLATGLIVLADWLASRIGWVRARHGERQHSRDPQDWSAHVERARRAASKALAQVQLTAPVWKPATSFTDMFPFITDPYPLQADLAKRLPALVNGPGLTVITAPTGDGKTETALFAAHVLGHAARMEGLGVFLPTMATTDAMHTRITEHVTQTASTPIPVTLLHSMAWLNADYNPENDRVLTDASTIAGEWIKGRHRGLLAGVAVGTWDTAALAALPIRFNSMRWLGLTGKTIIIDEAHAYDAYGHRLTERLLEWLGHTRTPVILLSATLTGTIATRLAAAYRTGAGHTTPVTIAPTYPGWTHIDATTGTVTTSETLPTTRARRLAVNLRHARHQSSPTNPDSRLATLTRTLQPMIDEARGCAAIVCNTVADAQTTARHLRTAWTGPSAPLVQLLHARMPARQRQGITRRIENWAGKPRAAHTTPQGDYVPARGRRPSRPAIVVATQVIEQSLDVDFDHVISDLAPVALLLQRAGRCHRHPRTDRPAWAPAPAMTVLIPTGKLPPQRWGTVYSENLLNRTVAALQGLTGRICAIPEDVQGLVDQVYAADWTTTAGTNDLATEQAMRALADTATIPTPTQLIRDLHPLTTHNDETLLATRLGADSVRVLPVWTDTNGQPWLDRQTRHRRLPTHINPRDTATIRNLIAHTIQIDHRWLQGHGTETNTPTPWQDIGALHDVLLLPQRVTKTGERPYQLNGRTHHLSQLDGLVRE
ncbi:CRISPR-associated helicase Cas3' [Streptomyces griseofuscus]|uniref:CRISPR-associated helicase Cas3' n=1 Tax=Streptomyces griseofuscus TaxID=146922 RepID=UPI003798F30B